MLVSSILLSSCNNRKDKSVEEFDINTIPSGTIHFRGMEDQNTTFYIVILTNDKFIKKFVPQYVWESLSVGTVINTDMKKNE